MNDINRILNAADTLFVPAGSTLGHEAAIAAGYVVIGSTNGVVMVDPGTYYARGEELTRIEHERAERRAQP